MNMEQRLDNLENNMREIRRDVSNLQISLAEIKIKLSHLATKEMLAQSEAKLIQKKNSWLHN